MSNPLNHEHLDEDPALRQGKPCYDCGQTYPTYVTRFAHRDLSCDLVCANCYAIRLDDANVDPLWMYSFE